MNCRIVKLEYAGQCKLKMQFDHGSVSVADLRTLASRGGLYRLFAMPLYVRFAQVTDYGHTVVWPGGMDIGADSLCLRGNQSTEHAPYVIQRDEQRKEVSC